MKIKDWIFRTFFYWDYVHMCDLADDVISLEHQLRGYSKEKSDVFITSCSDSTTLYWSLIKG